MKIEVWFQDEMRTGLKGTITNVWGEKGLHPMVPQQQDFDWAYIFGAVCPEDGKASALVLPYANMDAMNMHLKEISQSIRNMTHAIVVLYKAGWHTTKKLKVPENLTLLPLPSYSPQLNPAEHLWKWMRHHHLSNRTYSGYRDIVDSCCEAWCDLIADKNRLRSMCWFPWIKEAIFLCD